MLLGVIAHCTGTGTGTIGPAHMVKAQLFGRVIFSVDLVPYFK